MILDLTPSEIAMLFIVAHRTLKKDMPSWADAILNRIEMPDSLDQWYEIANVTGDALLKL